MNFADYVNWWTGNDPKANAVTKYDNSALANEKYVSMLERFQEGAYGGKGKDRRAQEVEALRVEAMKDAPLRDRTTALISSGMPKADAAYQVYGVPNGLSQLLNADSMQTTVAALNTMGMNIQELANTTPAKITEAMEKMNAPEVIQTKPYFSQEKARFSHLTLCFVRAYGWPTSYICSH
jgi:hypothetical protein